MWIWNAIKRTSIRSGCGRSSAPVLFVLGGLSIACVACADRDIVYSARYYYPSSDGRKSHFHLYRVNLDGTHRTQITDGRFGDIDPLWSPDGYFIAFQRTKDGSEGAQGPGRICLVKADGGPVRTLLDLGIGGSWDKAWSPDGRTLAIGRIHWVWDHEPTVERSRSVVYLIDARTGGRRHLQGWTGFVWSPDSTHGIGLHDDGGTQIIDLATGRTVKLEQGISYPVWLNQSTVVGLDVNKVNAPTVPILRFIGLNGKEKRTVAIKWSAPTEYPRQQDDRLRGISSLALIPGDKAGLICAIDAGNSTLSPSYDYYRINLASGEMKHVADGQFLSWASDGNRFCAASVRDIRPLGKQINVWMSSLHVGNKRSGTIVPITPGDVWVVGADWLKKDSRAKQRK